MVSLLYVAAPAVFASGETLVLVPLTNETSETRYDVIADRIVRTIELGALLGTGSAVIVHPDPVPDPADPAAVASLASRYGSDRILTGRISPRRAGGVVLTFTASGGRIEEEAADFYDALERADSIAEKVFALLTGEELGWGFIEPDNEGARGAFRVFALPENGEPVEIGNESFAVPLVPEGTIALLVTQDRPFGEYVLFSGTVTVNAGEITEIAFGIPGLTSVEESAFEMIDREILDNWYRSRTGVRETLDTAIGFLEGTAESSIILADVLARYRGWKERFDSFEPPPVIDAVETTGGTDKTAPGTEGRAVPADEVSEDSDELPLGRRLAAAGAVTLTRAASFAGAMSREALLLSLEAEAAYTSASENFDALYTEYTELHNMYLVSSAYSTVSWALFGTAGLGGALFLPESEFLLSPRGKNLFAASFGANLAGDILSLMAAYQSIAARKAYGEYAAASENIDSLYGAYQEQYLYYVLLSGGAYGLWLAGGAGTVRSLSSPGERTPVLSTIRARILAGAGSFLVAAGNVSASLAFKYRAEAEGALEEYRAASGNFDALWDTYTSKIGLSRAFTLAEYGLLLGGGLTVMTALYLPGQRAATAPSKPDPLSFTVIPGPDGLTAGFRLSY